MTCVVTDLFLPLCLTLTYNVSTATLISSSVDCGECQFEAEFDFETKNLVIKVPFIGEGILSFNDNFQASCITKDLTLASEIRNNLTEAKIKDKIKKK
ncbi:hypothetical protein P4597_24130 [Peribacillus simplex]|uniref:hypothetical protein n=1 Tax=Peribacillus simplex TaxID=1478 RepID=UPI002E1C1DFA|nr:hypothetical protein [Peribacillus simplex]